MTSFTSNFYNFDEDYDFIVDGECKFEIDKDLHSYTPLSRYLSMSQSPSQLQTFPFKLIVVPLVGHDLEDPSNYV